MRRLPTQARHAPAQGRRPRYVVPAMWWQAAEPVAATAPQAAPGAAVSANAAVAANKSDAADIGFAYVGATVGPGFDFADFTFGRDDPALRQAPQALQPDALQLL